MYTWSRTVLAAMGRSIPPVLVTITGEEGSAPRTAGARMLVFEDGSINGTVGGGKYEASAMAEAAAMQREWSESAVFGKAPLARTMHFSLNGVSDMDMICGGNVTLLLELLPASELFLEVFQAAARAQERNEGFVLITRLWDAPAHEQPSGNGQASCEAKHTARHFYLCADNTVIGPESLPEAILSAAASLKDAAPKQVYASSGVYLLEAFPASSFLHIFGGGHVAKALADIAHGLAFRVIVLEDRPEFITTERFPHAELRLLPGLRWGETTKYLEGARLTSEDAIVIMTRGHAHDRDVLAAALPLPAGYLGMIGSRSKWRQIRTHLEQAGIPAQSLDRVRTPIGLDIGAETPAEIAVSIAAELIAWRSGKAAR